MRLPAGGTAVNILWMDEGNAKLLGTAFQKAVGMFVPALACLQMIRRIGDGASDGPRSPLVWRSTVRLTMNWLIHR
jgi:hypothetical protein